MFAPPTQFRRPAMFGPPTMFSGIPAAATGVESQWCLSFDGSNDSVSIPGALLPTSSESPFSAAMWVYVSAAGSFPMLICKGTVNSSWLLFLGSGNTKITLRILGATFSSTSNNSIETPSSVLTVGQWHHVAAVWSGTSGTIYVDGVSAVSSSATNANQSWGATDVYLASSASSNYLNGREDDFRFYNRALSSTEVGYLANNTQQVTSGLVAYLDMEEGTGTTTAVKDSTGATIATATLTNGPTWSSSVPPLLA